MGVEEGRDRIKAREREGVPSPPRKKREHRSVVVILLYVVLTYCKFVWVKHMWSKCFLDAATHLLEACGCSPLAKWTGWQNCSCTPMGCPLASPPAGRATGLVLPPSGWTGHYAPVPVLSKKWGLGKHPHSPCSGTGCCLYVAWSGYGTLQMSP